MKHILSILFLFTLTACAGAKTLESGPTIDVTVTNDTQRVRSDDPAFEGKGFKLGTDKTEYEVTISVGTRRDGDKHDENMETKAEKFPAKTFAIEMAVDGAALPAPSFDPKNTTGSDMESDPIKIPGTSKGKTLSVHVVATDSRGLKSNAIDFNIPLN